MSPSKVQVFNNHNRFLSTPVISRTDNAPVQAKVLVEEIEIDECDINIVPVAGGTDNAFPFGESLRMVPDILPISSRPGIKSDDPGRVGISTLGREDLFPEGITRGGGNDDKTGSISR